MTSSADSAVDPPGLAGRLKGYFSCFITAALVAVCIVALDYVLNPQTRHDLGELRQFTPALTIALLKDAGTDCVPKAAAKNLMESREACRSHPILGDWPQVGHWAARIPAPFKLFWAAFDVSLHLIFTRHLVPAAVGVSQLLLGFGISLLIAQMIGRWNDYWLAVFLILGTLIIGAAATCIVLNIAAALYHALTHLIPNWPTNVAVTLTAILGVECKSFGAMVKRLVVDRPADSLASRATKSIERYLS